MKLTTLDIKQSTKKFYNKPQALELSTQSTAGGIEGAEEQMMSQNITRKAAGS